MDNLFEVQNDKKDILNKVCYKLINQPNSSYRKLLLQNLTYNQDFVSGTMDRCSVMLC